MRTSRPVFDTLAIAAALAVGIVHPPLPPAVALEAGSDPPAQMTATPTAIAPYSVTGAVTITIVGYGGSAECRSGGPVDVRSEFSAHGVVAPVTAMRVFSTSWYACHQSSYVDPAQSPWQPLAQELRFQIRAGAHTIHHALSVQYRDELGNLSPAYCDKIDTLCVGTPTAPPWTPTVEPPMPEPSAPVWLPVAVRFLPPRGANATR